MSHNGQNFSLQLGEKLVEKVVDLVYYNLTFSEYL